MVMADSSMSRREFLRLSAMTAAALGLGVGLSGFLSACAGTDGASGTPGSDGQTPTSAAAAIPPIDLAAPATFRTASFAFG